MLEEARKEEEATQSNALVSQVRLELTTEFRTKEVFGDLSKRSFSEYEEAEWSKFKKEIQKV